MVSDCKHSPKFEHLDGFKALKPFTTTFFKVALIPTGPLSPEITLTRFNLNGSIIPILFSNPIIPTVDNWLKIVCTFSAVHSFTCDPVKSQGSFK